MRAGSVIRTPFRPRWTGLKGCVSRASLQDQVGRSRALAPSRTVVRLERAARVAPLVVTEGQVFRRSILLALAALLAAPAAGAASAPRLKHRPAGMPAAAA